MQEIFLSEIIDDSEVINSLIKDVAYRSKVKKEISKFQIPITNKHKFYHVPEDINSFITGIYSNMKVFVLIRTQNMEVVDNIINNFILYMLDNNKKGRPRYTMYDPIKYPKQMYFKWFISNLRYFYLTYRQQLIRDQFTVTLSETDYNKTVGTPGNKAANIDIISQDFYQASPDSCYFVAELMEWLRVFSSKYEQYKCFEANAFNLFKSKILGEENNSFAKRMGISSSAASQWTVKLRRLVKVYLAGDPNPICMSA